MRSQIRTFVAVELSDEVKQHSVWLAHSLSGADADVKWVEAENLHVTVKFLGDVDIRKTAEICQALQRACDDCEPFTLELAGAGAFPSPERPRTLWLGAAAGSEPMVELHDHVEKALRPLGFSRDGRRFHPHVTLGRVRRSRGDGLARLLRENESFAAGEIVVSELVLFSSQLERHGPTYGVLGRATL